MCMGSATQKKSKVGFPVCKKRNRSTKETYCAVLEFMNDVVIIGTNCV